MLGVESMLDAESLFSARSRAAKLRLELSNWPRAKVVPDGMLGTPPIAAVAAMAPIGAPPPKSMIPTGPPPPGVPSKIHCTPSSLALSTLISAMIASTNT